MKVHAYHGSEGKDSEKDDVEKNRSKLFKSLNEEEDSRRNATTNAKTRKWFKLFMFVLTCLAIILTVLVTTKAKKDGDTVLTNNTNNNEDSNKNDIPSDTFVPNNDGTTEQDGLTKDNNNVDIPTQVDNETPVEEEEEVDNVESPPVQFEDDTDTEFDDEHPSGHPQPPQPSAGYTRGCEDGYKQIELYLSFDQDALRETGFTLQCNHEEVWNIPMGQLQDTIIEMKSQSFMEVEDEQAAEAVEQVEDGTTTTTTTATTSSTSSSSISNPLFFVATGVDIHAATCVEETVTCDFTIQDSYGDGLTEGMGYYSLTYGPKTVATYHGEEEFYEQSYCLGPNCPEQLEYYPKKDNYNIFNDCDDIYFAIKFDSNPGETEYKLECNNEVIFYGPYPQHNPKPFEEIEEETCMAINSCCRLIVSDGGFDGLTVSGSSSNKFGNYNDVNYGWIYLEYALMEVLNYNGNIDGPFDTKIVEFGTGC